MLIEEPLRPPLQRGFTRLQAATPPLSLYSSGLQRTPFLSSFFPITFSLPLTLPPAVLLPALQLCPLLHVTTLCGSNTPQISCVLKTSRQRKKRRVSSAHTPAGLQLWEAPILTERRCTAPPREQNINPCSSPWKRSEDPLRRGCGPRRATAAVGYSSVSLTDEAAGDVFAAEPGAQERSAARL